MHPYSLALTLMQLTDNINNKPHSSWSASGVERLELALLKLSCCPNDHTNTSRLQGSSTSCSALVRRWHVGLLASQDVGVTLEQGRKPRAPGQQAPGAELVALQTQHSWAAEMRQTEGIWCQRPGPSPCSSRPILADQLHARQRPLTMLHSVGGPCWLGQS
jgi:hypothetical protein